MPRAAVTALRADGRGRVAVELDGSPWRVLPEAVVVRAGLGVGLALDRERLRAIARARRADRALTVAVRAVGRREHTTASLSARLAHAGVPTADAAAAVERLAALGAVDDRRYAGIRARSLAGRGYGDAFIAADLERSGVGSEGIGDAIAALEPERARAARMVERRGASARLARLLAARGFSEDAVEHVIASIADDTIR